MSVPGVCRADIFATDMETVKQCQLCDLRTTSLAFLLKHLTVVHSTQPGFSFCCGLNSCQRTFQNITTYKHHVYSAHTKNHTNLQLGSSSSSDQDGSSGVSIYEDDKDDSSHDSSQSEADDDDGTSEDEDLWHCNLEEENEDADPIFADLKKAAATWILKIKEKHKLSQFAVNKIIEDVTILFQISLSNIFEIVSAQLKSAGVHKDVISAVSRLFDPDSEHGRPFKGLETEYHQQQYFKRNFAMVEPQTIVLGSERRMRGSGQKRKCVEVRDEMKYISLISTLERLLQNEKLVQAIETSHESDDQVMRDYCDAKHFKSHPLGTITSQWLQIFLYYDDLELCNPLGSRRTIHKIGAFYFSIGNCSPKVRSKMQSIQLLALVKNSFIKKYGMNCVLKPIVDDLKLLENGYMFSIFGLPRLFYGALCVVSADNPASCVLGGFKETTSAFRPCRQCLATKNEMKSAFRSRDFVLRTSLSHEQHLRTIEDPNENRNSRSKEYGINYRSLLDELQYFDVTSGSLIPDVMHDVLEGVLQYEAKLVLQQFISEDCYFSLAQLNQQILSFELGYAEVKSRPTPISVTALQDTDSHLLKQSASQMWLLGRLLPQMIGHWIPRENEHWLSYLLLLDIIDILFAPDVTLEDVSLLSVLIQDHHTDFHNVYPTASVLPKMHFMVHMPGFMRQYGPLKHHWTMRYESKHSYFKRLANSLGNYINICHTLSIRHEQLQCYLRMDGSTYSMNIVIGPGKVITKPSGFPAEESQVYKAKWVEICGTIYKRPCILVVGDEDDFPVFGRVSDVYVVDENIIFRVQLLHTCSYDPHYHSFQVNNTTSTQFFSYSELLSYVPLHERVIPNCSQICVALKHRLTF